ncbi:hypothetical protein ACIHEI_00795 [Kitasatospora sp. NPDC051984]|uniref:hypothetical protein n=1 Tax=Kitasatospora sp. NPDC051984 TaxID=3364059 RepID=UPI0037C915C0
MLRKHFAKAAAVPLALGALITAPAALAAADSAPTTRTTVADGPIDGSLGWGGNIVSGDSLGWGGNIAQGDSLGWGS